jgi:YqxM protein
MLYSLHFIISQITSATNATFIDNVQSNVPVSANYSWDRSSLSFIEESVAQHYGFNCTDGFYADIKNGGDKMMGSTPYFVHYLPGEDPNKNKPGTLVFDEGVIPSLGKNETKRLKFLPEEKPLPGHYKFSAYQRPLHNGPNTSNGRFEIWGIAAVIVTTQQINACYDNNPSTNVHIKAVPEMNQIKEMEGTPKLTTKTSKSKKQEVNKKSPSPLNKEKAKDTKQTEKIAPEQSEEAVKEMAPKIEQDSETNNEKVPEAETTENMDDTKNQ